MLSDVLRLARRYHLPPEGEQALADLFRRATGAPTSPTITLDNTVQADPAPTEAGRDRYEDLGLIGTGGMGEVRRVRDRELKRTMAMKVIKRELLERPTTLARFVEEAQATAQLQHPGIVPVHELGRLSDVRLYFTMREVRGRELSNVIRAVHEASPDRWRPAGSWTFRRLIASFHQVCRAVAYAHSKGVVHRDLKPNNVMLGAFGEALVLDWGLAKVMDAVTATEPVVTSRSADDALTTREGTIAGTPAYMPPEQARGEVDTIDARSDVYALGAILYEALSGRPPYEGRDGRAVLHQVLQGPPPPPAPLATGAEATFSFGPETADAQPGPAPEVPPELVEVCARAMSRAPSERYQSATELAEEIGAWLDGAKQRERALEVVREADERLRRADALRVRARARAAEGAARLEGVEAWRPEAEKLPGWTLQEEAAELARAADLEELEHREMLRAALEQAPDLEEAHARLADLHWHHHASAEGAGRLEDAAQAAALLRRHDRTGRYAAYLSGVGALTLVTDPPGAEVVLRRYERRHKRLMEVEAGVLGTTPLERVDLPMGSYVCVLRHPGRAEVRYPVHIARGVHWHGERPGGDGPHPIALLALDALGRDDCYVPAGWFEAGDDEAFGAIGAGTRLWCDGFALRRFPVTNADYIRFLDDLVAHGRAEEALRWAPRERGGAAGERGAVIYGRDTAGRFVLRPDVDGDVWARDMAALMVDWHCARAYAAWEAARTGQPWRLPWDFEREKAARGVDGRSYPWGNGFDASYACIRDSHAPGERPLPHSVDSFGVDVSPYGVRGLGGNTRDWCADAWSRDGDLAPDRVVRPLEADGPQAQRVVRGGICNGAANGARCAFRLDQGPTDRFASLGFRLARSVS